jgi:hypothetical protein
VFQHLLKEIMPRVRIAAKRIPTEMEVNNFTGCISKICQ